MKSFAIPVSSFAIGNQTDWGTEDMEEINTHRIKLEVVIQVSARYLNLSSVTEVVLLRICKMFSFHWRLMK